MSRLIANVFHLSPSKNSHANFPNFATIAPQSKKLMGQVQEADGAGVVRRPGGGAGERQKGCESSNEAR